jgi:polysaccharide biosynthesis protein PslH
VFSAVHRIAPPEALRNRRRSQLFSLWSPSSFHTGSLHSSAMQGAIDTLTALHGYDVIQVESSQMGGFDFPSDRVLVLDEHNVEYELLRRVATTDRSMTRRMYHGLEQRKVHAEELRAWRRCDGCAVTSAEYERTVHTESPSTATRVVPNAVDLEGFAPSSTPVQAESIVFVGTMNFRPNADAVLHFVQDILPLVRRSRPSATLTVVGQNAPAEVRRLAGPAVRITGVVDDVRPYLATASVVIAPLRVGGGTRLKVLEGLAMGKAVVSTTIGCEGLAVVDGEHLLVADDPDRFADCVVELMGDVIRRDRLGRAGRELVERSYSWPAAAAALHDFHSELLAVRRGAR